LSHRRQAIVDLSTDADQPMSNIDGSLKLTFNGEIYNHTDLHQELEVAWHVFKTNHSDCEVLIHGYKAWEIDGLVQRLDGMYAFAIWDVNSNKLVLARDRIGIKPFYFSRFGGVFRFASEIKAILSDNEVPREADHIALNHYLSFMVAPAPLTLFSGIYKLPATHIMEVGENGEIQTRRYWDALPSSDIQMQKDQRKNTLMAFAPT
jgi:asparagine synthase (glutamine-hydrolysing)